MLRISLCEFMCHLQGCVSTEFGVQIKTGRFPPFVGKVKFCKARRDEKSQIREL